MAQSDQSGGKTPRVEIALSVLDLVKAALWPGFALLLFVGFYGPFYDVAKTLPDMLGRTNVITIGQLNIKLNAALANQVSPGVRAGLKGLDGPTARRLLVLADPNDYCIDPVAGGQDELVQDLSADEQLQSLRMVSLSQQPPQNGEKCYEAAATDLGKKTQDLLLTILTDALTSR